MSVSANFAALELLAMQAMSLHYLSECPSFSAIRASCSELFQDAEGCMCLFMWYKHPQNETTITKNLSAVEAIYQ